MTERPIDVVGIGNAIVDVITQADEAFLDDHDMAKGIMHLVETDEQADVIYRDMGPGIEASGGSAANTIAGLCSLGGVGSYIGLVRDDQLGAVFAHDIRATGVGYEVAPAAEGPSTARCLILVTDDAQRTMNTYLGVSAHLAPEHVDPALVAQAKVVYCEGYLWDRQSAKDALVKGMAVAEDSGAKVAFAISDAFCVDRHRDEFLFLAEHRIDILFANEEEITSLYEVDDFDTALQRVREHCEIACLTRSAKGSVIVAGDEVHVVDAHHVDEVVDTTGAGDLYASGFLYGYTQGLDLATCARLGGLAAAEVISHYGARPETPLSELAPQILG